MTQTANKQGLQKFSYVKPATQEKPKITIPLARSEVLSMGIQVAKEGGETNLHAHAAMESTWFVLKGRVRFYDTDDHTFGEYGQFEGLGIPRAAPYWFESASDEDLEVLHITAVNTQAKNTRLNFTPLRARQEGLHEDTGLRDLTKHNAKPMQSFAYRSPEFDRSPKMITNLYANQDLLNIHIQKIKEGGETNMHAHTGVDSAWFVLQGAARFHGYDGDTHDLGLHEGVLIPKATPYWFESAAGEPLEILHVLARDTRVEKNERVNYEELKDWQASHELGGRPATASER